MAYRGYHFFVGDVELPFAPSELKITIGSNNQTVNLINGSEINVLKNPKLTEIEFDIELPRGRQYPFANKLVSPEIFLDYFEKLMVNKTPVNLVITRPNPFLKNQGFSSNTYLSGTKTNDFFSHNLKVALEGYDMKEDAENAYDITVSLKFKQYIEYGTIKKTIVKTTSTNKTTVSTPTKTVSKNKSYTVKKGDCLWNISRKYYGTGTKYKTIYNANKTVIEKTAKKYGKKSSYKGSTPGWWIYPGTKLTIPIS